MQENEGNLTTPLKHLTGKVILECQKNCVSKNYLKSSLNNKNNNSPCIKWIHSFHQFTNFTINKSMPRYRPRAKVLKFLQKSNARRRESAFFRNVLYEDEGDDDSIIDLIDYHYASIERTISSSRYLFRKKQNRNRTSHAVRCVLSTEVLFCVNTVGNPFKQNVH